MLDLACSCRLQPPLARIDGLTILLTNAHPSM